MRKNVILIILLLGILTVLWAVNRGSELRGTDNRAVDAIEANNPGYSPWFKLPWQGPDRQSEGFLFALQAAAGTGFICFYAGYVMGKNRGRG